MDKLRRTGPTASTRPLGATPLPGPLEAAPKRPEPDAIGTDRLTLQGAIAETAPAAPVMTGGEGDPKIRRLQECLTAHGYDPGPVDGQYGRRTENALLAFKQARGLPATAVVDHEVWRHLQAGAPATPAPAPAQAAATGSGAATDAPTIRLVQERLVAHGFDPGPVDGLYGRRTERALLAFKQSQGLPATATVDQEAWRRLQDAPAAGAARTEATAVVPQAAPATLGQGGDFDVAADPAVRAADGPTGRALPAAGTVTNGREAYQVLRELDHRPNPYSSAETERLSKLAKAYQDGTLTQTVRLSVDGGARSLTVKIGVGIDQAEALQAVSTMYAATHPAHRDSIREVHMFSGPSAFDEFWEQKYELTKDSVSEMTGGRGIVTFYNVGDPAHPQRQDLWDHEIGHVAVADERQESHSVPVGWSAAVAADRADRRDEFFTEYARHTVAETGVYQEDFAESYRGYMEALRAGDLDAFRRQYPNRAGVLDQLFS